jgi:ribosomal protein S18 acetylase RimI-like enzyme
MVRFERAQADDLRGLVALDAGAFARGDRFPAREWADLLQESRVSILVARVGSSLVGAVVTEARFEQSESYIMSLAVDDRFRRMGLATRLVHQALAQADPGLRTVTLEVREDNLAARTLYEKLGFSIGKRIKRYYADGGGAVVYRAPLADVLARATLLSGPSPGTAAERNAGDR